MAFDLTAAIHEAGAWVLGALGIVATAWGVRKRISGDSLAVTKNDIENSWIVEIKRERDEAVALSREQQKRIGALEMRNALMVERIERQDREIARIKRLLIAERPDLAAVFNSDFAPLPDPDDDTERKPL